MLGDWGLHLPGVCRRRRHLRHEVIAQAQAVQSGARLKAPVISHKGKEMKCGGLIATIIGPSMRPDVSGCHFVDSVYSRLFEQCTRHPYSSAVSNQLYTATHRQRTGNHHYQ
eukprot:scaffold7234_cov335-Prasinococcus_capsulatus_cf.AAC.14